MRMRLNRSGIVAPLDPPAHLNSPADLFRPPRRVCLRKNLSSRARRSGFYAAAAEELPERGVDVLLVVDAHAYEPPLELETVAEDREQRARASAVPAAALLAYLAVAEEIARLNQLVRESHGLLVVRVVVVAVGEVERVDVPVGRREARAYDVER